MVVFALQNVIADPPFSKIDLISCRNLLIYLGPEVQKKVLSLFHYSLKQGRFSLSRLFRNHRRGFESFSALDRKWKLFKRKDSGSGSTVRIRELHAPYPTDRRVDATDDREFRK